ncbi:hypothetical protein COF39_17325 [Bacillus toyonensis]|nr:hypothetical protein COF39_17325 [Bacillus toyonensis]
MNLTIDNTIREIKSKIDILTIVEESSLQLRKRGRNFIGLCPFHDEKTPSFSVNPHLHQAKINVQLPSKQKDIKKIYI